MRLGNSKVSTGQKAHSGKQIDVIKLNGGVIGESGPRYSMEPRDAVANTGNMREFIADTTDRERFGVSEHIKNANPFTVKYFAVVG